MCSSDLRVMRASAHPWESDSPATTSDSAAPWLDFAGMWLTKFVSGRFAAVTLIGGWAMGVGYLAVTALAIHQMWLRTRGVDR